uniref:SWIM-type domain-containing protein n=1 Tax=Acrobeloides nanus TaxID=290746 RepID=A0A914DG03_9BILA
MEATEDYYENWLNIFCRNQATTWKYYQNHRFMINIIRKDYLPGFYFCSCSRGFKRYPCKHSLLAMVEDGKIEVPEEIASQDLGRKRTSGRPKKLGRALEKE